VIYGAAMPGDSMSAGSLLKVYEVSSRLFIWVVDRCGKLTEPSLRPLGEISVVRFIVPLVASVVAFLFRVLRCRQSFSRLCVAILEAFGQDRSECGSPQASPRRPKPRASTELPSDKQGYVFQLHPEHLPLEASAAVSRATVESGGRVLRCPPVDVGPGQRVTTAGCRRAIAASSGAARRAGVDDDA
jgi:hypothetical protein